MRQIGGARWWGLVAAAALLLLGTAVRADQTADMAAAANPPGNWEFDLAFYSWIADITGDITAGDVTEPVSLVLAANVGGFGIGSASKFSWESLLFARYRLGEHWGLVAGYRALGYERESAGVTLDLIQHGPVLGASYSF